MFQENFKNKKALPDSGNRDIQQITRHPYNSQKTVEKGKTSLLLEAARKHQKLIISVLHQKKSQSRLQI